MDAGGEIPETFANYHSMPGCTPFEDKSAGDGRTRASGARAGFRTSFATILPWSAIWPTSILMCGRICSAWL